VASVALKNPVFYAVYPLIALTLFRCHPRLTALTGGYTVALYGGLFWYVASRLPPVWGGYDTELFGASVTVIGQLTKILILVAYVLVASYLAHYARALLYRLVRDEVTARGEKEAMERELELASQVQAQLLPGEYPRVEGLRLHGTIIEGRFVGGDYYDFIQLSAHSVLLLVGDVSGKGVPAALIMSGVRASARLLASMNTGLEELVFRLNEMLHESSPATSYLTLFAAEIDVAAGSLRYINAGHPPPLLHAPDGIHALACGTAPLGLFPTLPGLRAYGERFPSGSLLVACTDGVSERSNPAGEFYGPDSLRSFVERNRHLDCPDFAGLLLKEVRQFGANAPLEDDLTLVVARFDAASA
jgi:serine phosphatase RsbU (regulator of sigma subunit)